MIDIVIFAVVAVILFARLWAVFGTRYEEEKEKNEVFNHPPFRTPQKKAVEDEVSDEAANAMDEPMLLPTSAPPPPQSLAGGIAALQKVDPSFDEKKFLGGAKAAFGMIVSDFAKGDLSRIERFLGPAVLIGFQEAIKARAAQGQTLETAVREVRDADLSSVRLEGTKAYVTVGFVSLQANILRDATGVTLNGGSDQIERVCDTWTFSRDTNAADPNWQLVGTEA